MSRGLHRTLYGTSPLPRERTVNQDIAERCKSAQHKDFHQLNMIMLVTDGLTFSNYKLANASLALTHSVILLALLATLLAPKGKEFL